VSLDPSSPAPYLAGHLEDRFARDPRLAEQGLHVEVEDAPLRVIVRGTVLSPEDKAAVATLVAEALPGAELRDETALADYPELATREEVR
jgi:hypothetical protein